MFNIGLESPTLMVDALGVYGMAGSYLIGVYGEQILECFMLVGGAFSIWIPSWTMLMGRGVPDGMAQGGLSPHGSSVQIPNCVRSAPCTSHWKLLRQIRLVGASLC